ncbi:MAG: CapA family protein [Anaerolineaceae bacterium]|nr:CapA family protein [Anaerolineaceae bacterium]
MRKILFLFLNHFSTCSASRSEVFLCRRSGSKKENLLCSLLNTYLLLMVFIFPANTVFAEENFHHYTVACPFTTITDTITLSELKNKVNAEAETEGEIRQVWVSEQAAQELSMVFTGLPTEKVIADINGKITMSNEGVSCAVIPLKDADPTMKLIHTEHTHFPWDDVYDPQSDPLAVPADDSDFERDRATTLLITGTTALTRTVSYKMAQNGTLYPAEMVKSVFDSSDITHISNESSIWSLCPEPVLNNTSMQFCSRSDAIDVFDYLGVDIVELTGNHLRDYDWKPLAEMLELFDEKGYSYYGAGKNILSAAKPLFIEHNGNHFVFLGCNCAGPEHVYASERLPGVQRCDFDQMEKQIRKYSAQGYLVIATIQYYEIYSRTPSDIQKRDFQRLSDAGAVIVSGSQQHYSQTMLPMKDRFIHYGLGNLFFDQMDVPVKGTRQEFLDRYVFYDGRLLSVQLITTLLYDYSRPSLMSDDERADFLKEIFAGM